jgi:GNAT superfamily N-acetyltransferase
MIKITNEVVTEDILEEVRPLAESHYNEVQLESTGLPFVFPADYYQHLYDTASMDLFTARNEEGKVLGYLALTYHADYKTESGEFASEEGFYVIPEARGQGIGEKLISAAEAEAKDCSVNHMFMMFPKESPLMGKLGYDLAEYVYVKRFV